MCISSKFISCASYRNSHYENNQDKKKRPNFTLSYAIHLTTSSDKRYKIYLPQKEHSFRASVPVSEGMPQISRIKVKTYLNLSLGKRHQCCWLEPSSNNPRNDPKHFDFPLANSQDGETSSSSRNPILSLSIRTQTIELEFCVDLQLYHNIAGVAVTIVARNRFRWWRCYWGDDLARVVSRNLALLDLGV